MNGTVTRTIYGVLFLVVMLGGLLFHSIPFIILFAFITGVMLFEFYRMTMGRSYETIQYIAISFGVLLFFAGAGFFSGRQGLAEFVCEGAILLMGIMIASIVRKDHKDFLKTAYLSAGLLYIALPLALSNAVVFRTGKFSGLLMVAFFCIIWSSDVGAYCFGMLFGQKLWPAKMCPSISPKKSWAGFVGGLLLAMLSAAVLYWTGLFNFPIWHALAVAAIMHVAGVFGDLFESLWKRAVGVKDSGNLIPGHGGLLDRFDSSLFAIPSGMTYLLILQLV